jgi:hypothetical protein
MRSQGTRKNTLESSGQRMTDPRSGRRFELVLGGCGALGAFQAGVYEAASGAVGVPGHAAGRPSGLVASLWLLPGPPRERFWPR